MPTTAVKSILNQIQALDDDQRDQLDRELSRRLDAEWSAEVRQARKVAKRRGITQATIERAIERRRYGR